jgi:hypothetical protein
MRAIFLLFFHTVMAGKTVKRVFALDVPVIHTFAIPGDERRGCPTQGRAA